MLMCMCLYFRDVMQNKKKVKLSVRAFFCICAAIQKERNTMEVN